MKIRQGFVSNSSSSSFICGSGVTLEEAENYMRDLVKVGKTLGVPLKEEDYEIYEASPGVHQGWWDFYPEFESAGRERRVIVESTNDNSINYKFFDFIEDALGATRYHLG